MSNIDQVIDRARQPGGFSEQQQFTVARERAIRKMRESALADPHFYILELIQAAVANHADHVHIEVSDSELQFSYIGGGYAREELAQLFDFLFASKEDFEHADIRQLAVGINALMIMEPSRIIVESGEGSLATTDRIEIREADNTVEVGTPEKPLRGTFIRVEGLDRSAIAGKSNLSPRDYGPPECTAIEERCLAAPVPIIVNSEPVFGYTSQRTPVIFGYDNVVTFDEGDIYGSIGIPEHRHKESFKVMTWGVWIESTEAALMDETAVGGVICYDRLNKTADHSGIVRDERFDEMWARIRPYARQVVEGDAGRGTYRIKHLSGADIPAGNLREFFRSGDAFVVVDESVTPDQTEGELARSIGDALEAPVLRVAEEAYESVAVLAGSDSALLRPNLEAPGDLEFYRRPRASEPDRPWLTGAVHMEPLEIEELAAAVVAEEPVDESAKEKLLEWLGTRRPIEGTVYTPRHAEQTRELYVRVRTLGRVVWEGSVQSPFPGHILDIDLPAAAPAHLLQAAAEDASFAEVIGRVVAREALEELQTATRRALKNLTMHDEELPSETGRRIALAALGRSALKRLRRTSSSHYEPDIHFSLIRPQPGPDLLDLEIFEALDGTAYSLRQLESLMDQTAGLVYGVVPEVEPALEGLDRSRILRLDLERERQLITIVGDAAYVRVDRRDQLAKHGPLQIRDMAIGLRDFPDFPLLVEGGDPTTLDDERREDAVADLVEQLKQTARNPDLDAAVRREAIRHLQWFVTRRAAGEGDAPTYDLEHWPLFLDGEGRPATLKGVRRGFEQTGALEMIDGRSCDVSELGSLSEADIQTSGDVVDQLTMNTWVYRLLSNHGSIRSAFDFDFSDREARDVEATPSEAFLESRTIDADGLDGRVGVPADPPENPSIAVIERDRSRAYRMRQPAIGAGLTGFVHVEKGDVEERWSQIRSSVNGKRSSILESLLDRVQETERKTDTFVRSIETLFDFAARHLQFSRAPDGSVTPQIEHPIAERALDLPLIPTETGNPISVQRLIHDFCRAHASGEPSSAEWPPATPEPLPRWLDRHLDSSNIVEPPDHDASSLAESPEDKPLQRRLATWLQQLRPDAHGRAPGTASSGGASPPKPSPGSTEVRVAKPDEFPTADFRDGAPCRYVTMEDPLLIVDAEHPMVRRASNPDDSEAFAWLLLSCYAHINDLLEPVTNEHELEFQRRVAGSLDAF